MCFDLKCFLAVRKREIKKYYKRQEKLLEGFNEMESLAELNCVPGAPSEVIFLLVSYLQNAHWCTETIHMQEELKQLERSERIAIHASNIANLVLFIAKVYASVESRSLAVIASTLDSLLDLLSGFILWFTANAMRKQNQYKYPIGKKRMQPVVRVCLSLPSFSFNTMNHITRSFSFFSKFHNKNAKTD